MWHAVTRSVDQQAPEVEVGDDFQSDELWVAGQLAQRAGLFRRRGVLDNDRARVTRDRKTGLAAASAL